MKDVAAFFKVSASMVRKETKKIIDILCRLAPEYIKWPTEEEAHTLAQQFAERSRLPGVIGAIDGCHIPIIAPSEEQNSYINRKSFHSVLLQGICTAKKIFTNVSIGTPGRRHDVTALRNSMFWTKLTEEGVNSLFYDEQQLHLVGDSGYMCRTWCLTPFEFSLNLSRVQRRYNYALSQARVVIEHTFGLLKGRWRRLLRLWKRDVGEASDVILACCVLHNFCYINGDKVINETVEPQMVRREQARYNNDSEEEIRKGSAKREQLLLLF